MYTTSSSKLTKNSLFIHITTTFKDHPLFPVYVVQISYHKEVLPTNIPKYRKRFQYSFVVGTKASDKHDALIIKMLNKGWTLVYTTN